LLLEILSYRRWKWLKAQLHRDPILSRVTGTVGNALDLHFYVRLVAFGALPLLTLLATHFPAIGHYLVSFLQPSLEALKEPPCDSSRQICKVLAWRCRVTFAAHHQRSVR